MTVRRAISCSTAYKYLVHEPILVIFTRLELFGNLTRELGALLNKCIESLSIVSDLCAEGIRYRATIIWLLLLSDFLTVNSCAQTDCIFWHKFVVKLLLVFEVVRES